MGACFALLLLVSSSRAASLHSSEKVLIRSQVRGFKTPAGLSTRAAVNPPVLPYKRVATVAVYPDGFGAQGAVLGNVFFSASNKTCVAYVLPSLQPLWTAQMPMGESAEAIEAGNGSVFVTSSPESRSGPSHLVCFDGKTGRLRWSLPRSGPASAMAIAGDRLFISMKPLTISAIDLASKKLLWTTALDKPGKNSEGMLDLNTISVQGDFVATNCASTTFCLNAKTGQRLWSEPNSYMFHGNLVATQNAIWIPNAEGSVVRQLSTGRELWRSSNVGMGEFGGLLGGRLLGLQGGKVFCLEPATGKVAWSQTVGPGQMSGGRQYGAILGNTVFIRGMADAVVCSSLGKVLWRGKEDEIMPAPCWTDGTAVVCFDGERLMSYVHGQEARIPTDSVSRKAMAAQLMSRYDQLDDSDKKRLQTLGDDAFEPLLKAFLATCANLDAMGEKGNSYPLYSKSHDIGKILTDVTTAKRSNDLMAALDKVKSQKSSKPLLLTLLAKFGDPKVATPYFLREIVGVKTPGFEMYESSTFVAREYIKNSQDPRAVQFMIMQLKDPKSDPTMRAEAYWHIAGTGGTEGLDGVLAERHHRTLLRSIKQRVIEGFLGAGEFGKKVKALSEKKDAQGRTWGLLECGVLGSSGDLWLAERINGNWTNPLFTGVSTSGVSKWAKPAPPEPKFAGKTAKELVAGAWFQVLVGNPDLARDSDHDGLTDIEERRLGTNPNLADTDGDGDPDGVDPWPDVPSRLLSSAEQVLNAAFEARYHFDESEGAGLFFAPEGMKPFEMEGRKGPTMWVPTRGHHDWALPLEQCYDQGVAFISFTDMNRDAKKRWEERLIHWNKDHTEASVSISTYYGGLNGTTFGVGLRKIGDQWVVVSMQMTSIS